MLLNVNLKRRKHNLYFDDVEGPLAYPYRLGKIVNFV